MFKFGLMCCDASWYLWLANECAAKGICWAEMRPSGMLFYSAIPILVWHDIEMIVLLNMLTVAASAWLMSMALGDLYPALKGLRFNGLIRLAISALAHGLFIYGDAHTPLSDLPSACFALMGISLYIMGAARKNAWRQAWGGFFLGFSAFTRYFYLYPVLMFMGLAVLFGPRKKLFSKNGLAAFCLLLLLPILSQFALTHRYTGKWGYIAPSAQGQVTETQFSMPLWGFDTRVLNNAGIPIRYEGQNCLSEGDGIKGAVKAHDWSGIACLLLKRQNFYFGSYVGHSYMKDASERVFSGWILLASLAVIALSFAGMFFSGSPWLHMLPLLFMGANWGLAAALIPESRFLMVNNVFMACSGLAYVASLFGPAPARGVEHGV